VARIRLFGRVFAVMTDLLQRSGPDQGLEFVRRELQQVAGKG
jgi:hypothetical protein